MAEKIQHQDIVPDSCLGKRFDQTLAEMFPDYSRSRLKEWILAGQVSVNGSALTKPREKMYGGEAIEIISEIEADVRFEAQNIPLTIVYEDEDILVFFNVFKVMTSAQNHCLNAEINIPNSATDEVSAENEGRIIEKALIFYFMPKYNIGNRVNEIGELKNKLITLSQENYFKRIDFSLEVMGASEYFAFSSPSVSTCANHSFSFEISENDVTLNQIPSFV